MPTTYYHTVDGEIQGQTTAGVRTDYLTDALGSVVATVNSSAQVVNTYRYKPYGKSLAKTGSGLDPVFRWVGSSGYRGTVTTTSHLYIRRRHYDSSSANWQTLDPFLEEGAVNRMEYGSNNPSSRIDPSGLIVISTIQLCPQAKGGPYRFQTVEPVNDDARGVAAKVSPGLLDPDQAVRFCANTQSQYQGRVVVVNGSLFSSRGQSQGPIRNCLGNSGIGVDISEQKRSTMLSFGASRLSGRPVFLPNGKCNARAANEETEDPSNTAYRERTVVLVSGGVIRKVFLLALPTSSQRMNAATMCDCFKDSAGGSYYTLDGGSSTQAWLAYPPRRATMLVAARNHRTEVGNWLWMREKLEPAEI